VTWSLSRFYKNASICSWLLRRDWRAHTHTHTHKYLCYSIKNSGATDKRVLNAWGLSVSRVREVKTSHKLGACVWRIKISDSSHAKNQKLLFRQLIFRPRLSLAGTGNYLNSFRIGAVDLPLIRDLWTTWSACWEVSHSSGSLRNCLPSVKTCKFSSILTKTCHWSLSQPADYIPHPTCISKIIFLRYS
jgi:hypothetical protein